MPSSLRRTPPVLRRRGPLAKFLRDRDYIELGTNGRPDPLDVPIPEADLRRCLPAGDELWDYASEQGLAGGVTRLLEALS